jgi:integrase
MKKCNPKNERVKRNYFEWMCQADRKSDPTVDKARKAIHDFEVYTGFRDFKTFNKHQAVGFKKKLLATRTHNTGELLSKSTVFSTLRNLKKFFKWLAYRPGHRRLDLNQIEYFNLTEKETREATSGNDKRVPTLEQVKKLIQMLPAHDDIQRRNRALIACTILTGMRDRAMASLRLRNINLEERLIVQDPKQVKTKNSKLINSFFLPVGDDIEKIFTDWVRYLYEEKLFNDDDPVFPKTRVVLDENCCLKASGIEPVFWTTANPIRKIFKEAFGLAGMECYGPHSFRKTLTRLGEKICKTPEQFKAWSQNLGHEQVLTTFTSYGHIDKHRQGEIIRLITEGTSEPEEPSLKEISSKIDMLLKEKKTKKR